MSRYRMAGSVRHAGVVPPPRSGLADRTSETLHDHIEQRLISVAGNFPEHHAAEPLVHGVLRLDLHRDGIVEGDEVAAVLRNAVKPRHLAGRVAVQGVGARLQEGLNLGEVVDAGVAAGPVVPGTRGYAAGGLKQPVVGAAHAAPGAAVEGDAEHQRLRGDAGAEVDLYGRIGIVILGDVRVGGIVRVGIQGRVVAGAREVPRAVEVIGHDVDPVAHSGDAGGLEVLDLVVSGRGRDGQQVCPPVDCGGGIELRSKFLQQQRVVRLVFGPVHIASEAAADRILPVDVDAVEVVGADEVHAALCKRRAGGRCERGVTEQAAPGPSADRNQRLDVRVLGSPGRC